MNDMWTTPLETCFRALPREPTRHFRQFSDFKEIETVLKPLQMRVDRLFKKNHPSREQEALTGLPKSLSLSLPLRPTQFGPLRTL
jgi:hypothetical protein